MAVSLVRLIPHSRARQEDDTIPTMCFGCRMREFQILGLLLPAPAADSTWQRAQGQFLPGGQD